MSSATDGDGGGCPSFLTPILNTYKTGLRVSEVIRKTIYERRSEWPGFPTGEVEVGDVHLKAGSRDERWPEETSRKATASDKFTRFLGV